MIDVADREQMFSTERAASYVSEYQHIKRSSKNFLKKYGEKFGHVKNSV